MGRGKIQIKKIENSTNRQVTYSKRRNGMLKKAHELTVLCDAKVSLIMCSSTRKFHEFTSPSTTTKNMIDQYQKTTGIDLWNTHYEKMQEKLKKLKEMNAKIRGEIRQRIGEGCLNDLSMEQLVDLQTQISDSLSAIRERKYHVIKTQTDTCRKKVRNLEERHGNLLHQLEARGEESKYGVVEKDGGYNSAVAFANGESNFYALRLHSSAHPTIHHHAGGFGPHNLRLL